jgi:hypothetical protein
MARNKNGRRKSSIRVSFAVVFPDALTEREGAQTPEGGPDGDML